MIGSLEPVKQKPLEKRRPAHPKPRRSKTEMLKKELKEERKNIIAKEMMEQK